MNVFDLVAKITLDSSEYEKELESQETKTKGFGSKLGAALGTAGKVVAGGLVATGVAAGAAVIKLTQSAVDAYSQYEQLEGGVETLFGAGGRSLEEYAASVGKTTDEAADQYNKLLDAQQYVMNRSSAAWDTAGMSANEYMETVTGFSASLIQSLGGDSLEAAKVADRAIIDMGDNANKMGTNLGSVMNAYMGFAKGNYMMLDNLKLGYGGTKTEMERLINDAAKLTDVQEELGVSVDAGSMSFSNIINAISVMQKKMDIAGTTAKEGATTIEGSTRRMKSAWTNVVTSFVRGGTPLYESMWDLFNSIEDWMGNLVPAIGGALEGIGQFVEEAVPEVLAKIPGLIGTLLPKLLSAVSKLMASVGSVIPKAVQGIINGIKQMISSFGEGAEGLSMFTNLFESLKNSALTALTSLKEIFLNVFKDISHLVQDIDWSEVGHNIAEFVTNGIDEAQSFIVDMFKNIAGFISNIDWGAVGSTILSLIGGYFSELGSWALEKFNEAKDWITSIKWSEVGTTILDAIGSVLSKIGEYLWALFTVAKGFVERIDWVEVGTTIWTKITEFAADVYTWFEEKFTEGKTAIESIEWGEVGTYIWNAICEAFATAWEYIQAVFKVIAGTIEAIDWAAVGTFIWNAIKAAFYGAARFLQSVFELAVAAVKNIKWAELGTTIWNTIKTAFEVVSGWLQEKFEAARTAILNINWLSLGNQVWIKIRSIFLTVGGWLKDRFEEAKNNILDKIAWAEFAQSLWDKMVEKVKGIGDDIKAWLEDGINGLLNFDFASWGASVIAKIKSALGGIGDWFASLFNVTAHVSVPSTVHTGSGGNQFGGKGGSSDDDTTHHASGYINPFRFTHPTIIPTLTGNHMFGDGVGGEIVMSDRKLREITGSREITAAVYQLTDAVYEMSDSMGDKMSAALQQMGLNVDGREFARLVRSV